MLIDAADVADSSTKTHILGYYTLSICMIELEIIPVQFVRGLPRHPIPAVHLARLAVAREAQGRGLGSVLLADAIQRAVATSDNVGLNLIDVFAKDERVRQWYATRGFASISKEPNHLVMPMKAARYSVAAGE